MLGHVFFLTGFLFLIAGARFLVEGASRIARILKVSDLVIGLTVVAFGTSFPELSVNVFASIKGTSEIAIGNILGSNIFNILVILGVSAVVYPLKVSKGTVWKEIPLTLLAAVVLGVLANDKIIDGGGVSVLSRIDGFVLLLFFVIFVYYVFGLSRGGELSGGVESVPEGGLGKSIFLVFAGLLGLMIGARWAVNGAVRIASSLGVSEGLIGLTIVAVGTSLPELATSVVAAYKKNADIAVGNIVGSNIFNIFFILGLSTVIRPIGFEARRNADIIVTVISSLVLFLWMFTGKKRFLDRWEGIVFIILYVVYATFLVIRG